MNNSFQEKKLKQTRRNFFANAIRGIIASGLVLTGGYLLTREEPEESCSFDFTCSLCGNTDQCALSAAQSYRKYEQLKRENR